MHTICQGFKHCGKPRWFITIGRRAVGFVAHWNKKVACGGCESDSPICKDDNARKALFFPPVIVFWVYPGNNSYDSKAVHCVPWNGTHNYHQCTRTSTVSPWKSIRVCFHQFDKRFSSRAFPVHHLYLYAIPIQNTFSDPASTLMICSSRFTRAFGISNFRGIKFLLLSVHKSDKAQYLQSTAYFLGTDP